MSDKILFVDDEVNILDSMKRQLRKRFDVATAISGSEALEKFKSEGPFSVVVSDMRMPQMDGVELLARIKELYPDTVRLMLTGNADQETAIEAVNKGQIFRFLNKPCPLSMLVTSLALALRQYKLITAEKELLNKTLKGSVKVLSELLSFANPAAFSSGLRMRSVVLEVAKELAVTNLWQLEIAALMSQIGCVTLPAEVINKVYGDEDLDEGELEMFRSHPLTGAKLLEPIPRMEGVAFIIRNQLREFGDYDDESLDVEEVELCSQILKAVSDYDLLLFQGKSHDDSIKRMIGREHFYHPKILKILKKLNPAKNMSQVASLLIKDLTVGMVLEENIIAQNETLLAPKGQEITLPVLQGLRNFVKRVGVKEPVRVQIGLNAE